MTEEEKRKNTATKEESAEEAEEEQVPQVDIPEDPYDDEATLTEDETEKGKRPLILKKKVLEKALQERREGGEWYPQTQLGMLVKGGKIKTLTEALKSGLPLREPQIVDTLMGDSIVDEVLKVNMVQRMTDSGRRTRFSITVVVGNSNGYVGLGAARGKEVGPTIKKAIDNAKLNMIELVRGCGSWECGCMNPHSLPFKVVGKSGSTVVTLRPAPRGVGLAVGDVAKKILKLAGINDVWGFSKGQTKTTVNNARAVIDALKGTNLMKVQRGKRVELKHLSGAVHAPQPIMSEGGEDQ